MSAPSPISRIVCWRQHPFSFALSTDDDNISRRSEQIFGFWQSPSGSGSSIAQTFDMKVLRLKNGYQFHPTQGSYIQPELHSSPLPEAAPPAPIHCTDLATLMRAVETDAAMAVFNHPDVFVTAHGALLARGDDAILIAGPSHSGKSTTSCALWAAGWQLLADDVSLLNATASMATPLLRRVSLRHPSRALLGEDFWSRMLAATTCDATPEGYVFHPDEIEGRSRARTVSLRAIVFLQRLGAPCVDPGHLLPMPPVTALLALAPYTNTIRHYGMGETMKRLEPLINRVPGFDFGRAPLDVMVGALDRLLDEIVAG